MLRSYQPLLEQVRARGGEIVGLSSVSQQDADMAAASWGVGFPQLADPSCTLVGLMNERGWLTSVVERGQEVTSADGFMAQKLNGYRYRVGMLQPGVLALRGAVATATGGGAGQKLGVEKLKEASSSTSVAAAVTTMGEDEEGQPEVLLTWGSVPNPANKNGAANRLPAKQAWAAVERSLGGDFSQARPNATTTHFHDPLSPPWPLFYLLLMARGNFVRPAYFLMDTETAGNSKHGGRSTASMTNQAMKNVAVAAAGTCVGLWVAPKQTAAVLALYAAYFLSPGGPYAQIQKVFPPRPAL